MAIIRELTDILADNPESETVKVVKKNSNNDVVGNFSTVLRRLYVYASLYNALYGFFRDRRDEPAVEPAGRRSPALEVEVQPSAWSFQIVEEVAEEEEETFMFGMTRMEVAEMVLLGLSVFVIAVFLVLATVLYCRN